LSDTSGWIVGDSTGTRWRHWSELGPYWTSDREKATRYARREDAEAVHSGDDDAWIVQPFAGTSKPTCETCGFGLLWANGETVECRIRLPVPLRTEENGTDKLARRSTRRDDTCSFHVSKGRE